MNTNDTVTIDEGGVFWQLTNKLRYAKKSITIDETTAQEGLILQQMWSGSDGSLKWKDVDIVELED